MLTFAYRETAAQSPSWRCHEEDGMRHSGLGRQRSTVHPERTRNLSFGIEMVDGEKESGSTQSGVISSVDVRGGLSTEEALGKLKEAFSRLDFEESISWADHPGNRANAWVIEVTLAAPLGAFFIKFSEAAGTDAYESLRAWIDRLRESGRGRALMLRIAAEETSIEIRSSVPEEALEALSSLDWTKVGEGTLEWDPSRRRWRRLGVDL
jgi:hypothetical protein